MPKLKIKVIDELKAKNEEYLAGWKRALADYENLKNDLSAAKVDQRRALSISLAHALLPVIDNFQVATNHAPDSEDLNKDVQNWLQGVLFIAKQFDEAMASIGLERIKTVGEAFDPAQHESAGEREDQELPDQHVIEEVQTGWKAGDQIIRPAKVIINSQKTEK